MAQVIPDLELHGRGAERAQLQPGVLSQGIRGGRILGRVGAFVGEEDLLVFGRDFNGGSLRPLVRVWVENGGLVGSNGGASDFGRRKRSSIGLFNWRSWWNGGRSVDFGAVVGLRITRVEAGREGAYRDEY